MFFRRKASGTEKERLENFTVCLHWFPRENLSKCWDMSFFFWVLYLELDFLFLVYLMDTNLAQLRILVRCYPASNYWSSGRAKDVPSNICRTFPRDPIWPFQGRPNLTSKGLPNLTFNGHPWEIDSGRPHQDVLRTSPRGPSKYVLRTMWGHQLDVPKFLFTFISELNWLTKSF